MSKVLIKSDVIEGLFRDSDNFNLVMKLFSFLKGLEVVGDSFYYVFDGGSCIIRELRLLGFFGVEDILVVD